MATTSITEKQSTSKGQAWFCTTGLPSDIVIEVADMTFHLHKFPLMSKSRKLHLLITEQETNNNKQRKSSVTEDEEEKDEEENEEEEEIMEQEIFRISLPEFPGGSETFEIAAKFCYGVKIEITSSNVALLHCAGEYLEMTEEYSEDNLISKTDRFLTESVLNHKNIRECLKTLKSCEKLTTMEEIHNQISDRCIDSIAEKASLIDPSSLFGWPVIQNHESRHISSQNQILWNGIQTGANTANTNSRVMKTDSWMEELGCLSLPLYQKLISAMKSRDLSSDIIEKSLISYAKKSIPGLSRSSRKQATSSSIASETEQKQLLETIVTFLPVEKSSSGSSAMTRFLFGLLRTANILSASESCRTTLEKKIASQLEQATLDDLLIPSYSYLTETLYDVDCVRRILGCFIDDLEEEIESESAAGGDDNVGNASPTLSPVMLVGKLIDGYLSEIATDANLKPDKFIDLAMALPEHSRLFDDGLYRAVDVYIKAHPCVTEEEREKICGVMDCQKLTLEACTHAAQNERLPLRAVVQVLFFEQLQLRHAIAGSLLATELNIGGSQVPQHDDDEPARRSLLQLQRQNYQQHSEEDQDENDAEEEEGNGGREGALVVAGAQNNSTWRLAVRENQVLRLDMDSMRSRVQELERECSSMKRTIQKIEKKGGSGEGGWRSSLTKKFGCKFKTQVCDSQEPTVVETRRSRHNRQSSS
ncbi:hypothetical protein MKW94_008641 [Papaver nudicaule]|uniref:Phototropic-responsive NPH3 family protein n=1 Tax=Papaver nudicaule TaxID=74823 RepID=A0AA41V9E4_PAPNU|nr:hypothetical protein [Papaver nudicaule]